MHRVNTEICRPVTRHAIGPNYRQALTIFETAGVCRLPESYFRRWLLEIWPVCYDSSYGTFPRCFRVIFLSQDHTDILSL